MAAEHGDVSGFDLGGRTCVLVNRADLVRQLFSRHEADLRKPDFLTDSNRGHWGDGLTTLDMPDWHDRRAQLRPAFRPGVLPPRLDITRDCTLDMIDRWQPGATRDMTADIRLLAARLAARSVLDADVEGFGDPARQAGTIPMVEAMGEDFRAPGGGYGDARFEMVRPRAGADMTRTVAIIDAHLDAGGGRDDILSAWLAEAARAGRMPDRATVRGEMIQMLFASHLTLPLSLGACWHALAAHGAVADAIAAEADAMDWARPDLQQVLHRGRAMAAVKEALRLMPPAPILYREAAQAFDLGGVHIAAGHAVWVAPRLLHRDPRYFERPDAFEPTRFAAGGLPGASRTAYLPFGAGPRICIASHQSFQQMAIIVLLVAERYRLFPVAERANGFRVEPRPS
jgi:cytochrome P450